MQDRVYRGAGSPEGIMWGSKSTIYQDISTGTLYSKTTDGMTGWTQFFPPLAIAAPVIVQVGWDDADRADGALGTSPSGHVWRAGLGAAAPLVAGKQFAANAGATSVMLTDIPGLEEAGITSYHQVAANLGTGNLWLYACLSEPNVSGVVLQRGSDRIRVGTQNGGVVWAQENLIGAPGVAERITLKVAIGGAGAATATIYLNGTPYAPVLLPTVTLGTSTGVLLSGTAVADHWRVLRQELL